MEQSLLQRAIIEAMQDPKVVAEFAISVSKKIIEQKSNPSNNEDLYVRNHVVFAEPGDPKGTFMIAKEIEEAILEINPEFEIRTRTFGKALLSESKEQKNTNKGRAYFIRAIVADMKAFAEELTVEEAEVVEEKETGEKSEKKKDKKKDKKSKKEDFSITDESTEKEEASEIKPATPAEAFEPPVDVAQLISATEGFDTIEEYKEFLEGMSKGKLIKHINAHKMPISCENVEEDVIVGRIIDLVEKHLSADEEEVETAEAPAEDKKSKKDKKKDKKKAKDSIDSEELAKVGKKDKKSKKDKKDKKSKK